jgi:tryptophan-rich sensory protein
MTGPVVVAVAITLLVLGVGGATTRVGQTYRAFRKPAWNPPEWVFGPAWTVILGLAAWAGVLAWTHARDTGEQWRIGVLFGVNIVLHGLWSPLFFNLQRPDWALIEAPFLWLSILALIAGLTPISAVSGLLLAPYLLWVAFAIVLNAAIVRLNPRARARP